MPKEEEEDEEEEEEQGEREIHSFVGFFLFSCCRCCFVPQIVCPNHSH